MLANRGVDMSSSVVDVSEPAPEPPKVEPPPPTGYGTEEDSLGSVFHLVLKVRVCAAVAVADDSTLCCHDGML